MLNTKVVKVLLFLSLIFSLIPILLAKVESTYTSYCDVEAWYSENNGCILDINTTIIGTLLYFSIFFTSMLLFYFFCSLICRKIKK